MISLLEPFRLPSCLNRGWPLLSCFDGSISGNPGASVRGRLRPIELEMGVEPD